MPLCELCQRDFEYLTKHHLVPQSKGGKKADVAMFCRQCAAQIHELFSNRVLAHELNTLEKLRLHPDIQRYIAWARKQKRDKIKVRRSMNKRWHE